MMNLLTPGSSTNYLEEAKEANKSILAKAGLKAKSFLGDDESKTILSQSDALSKAAAKKSLAKGAAGDIAMQIGGAKVTEALGGQESPLGGAASGAMMGAKFGPKGAIIGAVAGGVMGLMGASEKRAAAKAQARAKGIEAQAGAEMAKAEAQRSMSRAISNALLGGKQTVRL